MRWRSVSMPALSLLLQTPSCRFFRTVSSGNRRRPCGQHARLFGGTRSFRRGGDRGRAAQGGEETCLAFLGLLDVTLLDVAIAADLFGQARDLDGKRVVVGR